MTARAARPAPGVRSHVGHPLLTLGLLRFNPRCRRSDLAAIRHSFLLQHTHTASDNATDSRRTAQRLLVACASLITHFSSSASSEHHPFDTGDQPLDRPCTARLRLLCPVADAELAHDVGRARTGCRGLDGRKVRLDEHCRPKSCAGTTEISVLDGDGGDK